MVFGWSFCVEASVLWGCPFPGPPTRVSRLPVCSHWRFWVTGFSKMDFSIYKAKMKPKELGDMTSHDPEVPSRLPFPLHLFSFTFVVFKYITSRAGFQLFLVDTHRERCVYFILGWLFLHSDVSFLQEGKSFLSFLYASHQIESNTKQSCKKEKDF